MLLRYGKVFKALFDCPKKRLMLICCERKTLLFRWNGMTDKFKRTVPSSHWSSNVVSCPEKRNLWCEVASDKMRPTTSTAPSLRCSAKMAPWCRISQFLLSCSVYLCELSNNNGLVRFSYNPYFSACFFSRNSIFLSQQINRNSISACFFSEANRAKIACCLPSNG